MCILKNSYVYISKSQIVIKKIRIESEKKSEHLCSDFLFSKNFTQNNKIYDITGRILNKYTLKEGFNRVVTFLLSDGMYIFKYSYESSSKSQLVIKK